MSEIQNSKRYDLEERTYKFTKQVINLISRLPKLDSQFKQVILNEKVLEFLEKKAVN